MSTARAIPTKRLASGFELPLIENIEGARLTLEDQDIEELRASFPDQQDTSDRVPLA